MCYTQCVPAQRHSDFLDEGDMENHPLPAPGRSIVPAKNPGQGQQVDPGGQLRHEGTIYSDG